MPWMTGYGVVLGGFRLQYLLPALKVRKNELHRNSITMGELRDWREIPSLWIL